MAFFSKTIKNTGLKPAMAGLHMLFGALLVVAYASSTALAADTTSSTSKVALATIKKANISQQKKQTVLSVTLDKPVKYKVFTLKAPHRLVIDLQGTKDTLTMNGKKPGYVSKLRHAKRNEHDLRIVLDLKQAVTPKATLKGRQLKVALSTRHPDQGLEKSTASKVLKTVVKNKKSEKNKQGKPKESQPKGRQQNGLKPSSKKVKQGKPVRPAQPAKLRRGDFVVAIDAGHGGKDPGAIGARGTREKDIALQIARKLKLKIDRTPGMKGVLVRDGDYYIPLRQRMQIARKKHADLFVSIHADANPNRHLTGSSVYILSENGASSEAARWLASNENAYEKRLGETSLHGKDTTLASMLMDLSQAATIDNSLLLANNTLRELGRVTPLLHHQVESAAFVVLKSPDIPSMLVETAFISNPSEERHLQTAEYQNKLANAVFNGVRRFQLVHAPGGKLKMYANNDRHHIVKPGDSLSEIARKYGISSHKLSRHNNLNSTTIRVGQKIYIPARS